MIKSWSRELSSQKFRFCDFFRTLARDPRLRIQITSGLTPETIQEKLDRGVDSSKHHSTVRDILPGITSHHELSGMFAEAQKLSILNEWHANNKNTSITANNLGISDSTVIKALPQIDFD